MQPVPTPDTFPMDKHQDWIFCLCSPLPLSQLWFIFSPSLSEDHLFSCFSNWLRCWDRRYHRHAHSGDSWSGFVTSAWKGSHWWQWKLLLVLQGHMLVLKHKGPYPTGSGTVLVYFFLSADTWAVFLAGWLVMGIAGMSVQSGKKQSVVDKKTNKTLQHDLLKTNFACLNGSISVT